MIIFDYIFYRFYQFCKNTIDSSTPQIPACVWVSVIQVAILLFINGCFKFLVLNDKNYILFFFLLTLIVLAINGIFVFNKKKYELCERRFSEETKFQRKIRKILVIILIILTPVMYFWGIYRMVPK